MNFTQKIRFFIFTTLLIVSSLQLKATEAQFTNSVFLDSLRKQFSISNSEAKEIIKDFHKEMEKGLIGENSSLTMAPSFLNKPTGQEEGKYLALDLGGTNFRIVYLSIKAGKTTVLAEKKHVLEKETIQSSGAVLFDYIADSVLHFMITNKISFHEPLQLGFTFSFPVEQKKLNSGVLVGWTKGFSAEDVVGQDVVQYLNTSLHRLSITNVHVSSLIIDAVATLISKSYLDQFSDMAVILATGTDAAYVENRNLIKKINDDYNQRQMIVNLGWGNFNKIYCNKYDDLVDHKSLYPGKQKFEKLVSGMYLPEVFKYVTLDLISQEPSNFTGLSTLLETNIITSKDLAIIEGDNTEGLKRIEDWLSLQALQDSDLFFREELKRIVEVISYRSAKLSAILTCAVLLHIDPELEYEHLIAVDGSLFENYPNYKYNMLKTFSDFLGEKSKNIRLDFHKGGSCTGAAITAAMALRY